MCCFVVPCTLKDVNHLPADSQSHVYEDVGDEVLYQDILASPRSHPLPLFEHGRPDQRSEWRVSTQVSEKKHNNQ